MPFGRGPKMCAGYSLADVEMKVLLALWVLNLRMKGAWAVSHELLGSC